MRTLVVSDLHLGDRGGSDLTRGGGAASALFEALDGVDRLVLLGDTLELRAGPAGRVLETALPFFERLGAIAPEVEVVMVPGNHDHALAARWHARRCGAFGAEQLFTPAEASHLAKAIAGALGGASLSLAYPGIWLREDVYATHGHQLDVHFTVPTFERLAIALSGKIAFDRTRRWDDAHSPEDYEHLLAPVYAWLHAAAQSGRPGTVVNGGGTLRAWRALGAGAGGQRERALRGAFALGVAGLNRAGFGPLRREVSAGALHRAGLQAMGQVVDRLEIGAAHVIFGHTHRMGMLDGDAFDGWTTATGVRLHNTGSWVFTPSLIGTQAAMSPYWPGGALLIEDEGAPRLLRLLADRPMRVPG